MCPRVSAPLIVALLVLVSVGPGTRAQAPDAAPAGPVSFTRQIRPILDLRCLECHDDTERESGLSMMTVASLIAGGDEAGAAIVPGKPDESPILEYLTGVREPRMPKDKRPLSDQQIALIRSWIAAGAVDDSAGPGGTAALEAAGVPHLMPSHVVAADTAERLDEALFSGDAETLFVLRRQTRLARLTRVPDPPAAYPGSDNPIDQFVAAQWRQAGLPEADTPPPVVDDRRFIRRASLDVIGLVPTPDAVEAFVSDTRPDKRARLVDALLARRGDYAAHWAPFWEEALGSQTTRMQGGIPTRGNYSEWIVRQFEDNVAYDVFVASLIDPGMPRHKPSVEVDANGKKSKVGYVLNNTPTDTIQSAANIAQVFLATSMKCASCHNHFLNDEWPQRRFLAFAGLFASADLQLVRCEKQTGQFVPARFPFALPETPDSVPQVEQARLHRAALLLTDPTNPRFARAMVNRLWRRYLGLGLVEPADDFRLDRPASNPALLDWLADDFMRHGYDITHTMRRILTSRTYQHRYDPAREDRFDVQKPDQARYFRSPILRRLTAEQFIDSVRLVTHGTLDRRERVYQDRISTALTRALGRPASRNEISTSRPDDTAVLTALELMNGPELSYLAYTSPKVSAPGALETADQRTGAIEALYLAALGRRPTSPELKAATAYLAASARTATPTPSEAGEVLVFADELPKAAMIEGSAGLKSWAWVAAPPAAPHGDKAHRQLGETNHPSHHRVSGLPAVTVAARDRLVTWIFLDPAKPPREIMVEWLAGTEWEHRAYWASEERDSRLPDPPHRRWMGPLPEAGRWVRLEVPAGEVGITDTTPVTGWSFAQVGGVAYWDAAVVGRVPEAPATSALGDVLWALLSGPEFAFIQ